MGRSWSDEPRAQQELRSLFRAQWADGRVPHIVFNPSVGEDAYFPGPAFWQSSRRSAQAPRDVETSGITQPPVHARAALEMHRHATDVEASTAFLRWLYPRLVAEHDYLDGRRRPGGSSLPVFMHPWESGLDNSPAWDRDLADMVIPAGSIPPYVRHDLDHADAKDRPTNEAYDRFVFLAARYRDAGYDDDRLLDQVPFLVAGPLFNAIHLWSTHALAEIAEIVGADPVPHREDARRIHDAMLADLWDPETKRFGALDVIEHQRTVEDTIISFAPLLDPDLPKEQLDAIMADLRSAHFHPDRPTGFVAPSYDLLAADFDERRYWRGPVWINTNWLLWMGLRQHGQDAEAEAILLSSLRLVGAVRLPRVLRPVRRHGVRHGRLRLDRGAHPRRHRSPPGPRPDAAGGAAGRGLTASIRSERSAFGGPIGTGRGSASSRHPREMQEPVRAHRGV